MNLKCPNGELYTIATDSVDNAPNTLITDIDSFSKKGLAIGDQVYAEGERLYVGKNAAVMLLQVHVWRSKLPSYSEEEEILRNHVAAAQLWIEAHGKAGGMKAETANPLDQEMDRLLRERSAGLLEALSKGEVSLAFIS